MQHLHNSIVNRIVVKQSNTHCRMTICQQTIIGTGWYALQQTVDIVATCRTLRLPNKPDKQTALLQHSCLSAEESSQISVLALEVKPYTLYNFPIGCGREGACLYRERAAVQVHALAHHFQAVEACLVCSILTGVRPIVLRSQGYITAEWLAAQLNCHRQVHLKLAITPAALQASQW